MLNGCTAIYHHISYIGMTIHSTYEVISLLPFLSEKHICILFLIKHSDRMYKYQNGIT